MVRCGNDFFTTLLTTLLTAPLAMTTSSPISTWTSSPLLLWCSSRGSFCGVLITVFLTSLLTAVLSMTTSSPISTWTSSPLLFWCFFRRSFCGVLITVFLTTLITVPVPTSKSSLVSVATLSLLHRSTLSILILLILPILFFTAPLTATTVFIWKVGKGISIFKFDGKLTVTSRCFSLFLTAVIMGTGTVHQYLATQVSDQTGFPGHFGCPIFIQSITEFHCP